MEQVEFIEEIKSLEAFFEKELSIEQMKDWYIELNKYPVEKLRIAIRESKRQCKFLPKLAEFLKIIGEVKVQTEIRERIECKRCNGTGYIPYVKKRVDGGKIIPYTYMAICNCGNEKKYDGTQIKDSEHRSKFYTLEESELDKTEYKEIYSEQNPDVFLWYEQDVWK